MYHEIANGYERTKLAGVTIHEKRRAKFMGWGTPASMAYLGAFFAGMGMFLFAIFWGLGHVFMQ